MGLKFMLDEEDFNLFASRRSVLGSDYKTGRGRGYSVVVSALGRGDYESIQEAVDDLPYSVAGGLIYVDDGVYYLPSTLTLDRNNLEIVFSSKAVLKRKSDGAYDLIKIGNGVVRREDITLRGLVIDDISGVSASKGVVLDKVRRVKFIDCRINNTHDAPFLLDSASYHVFVVRCITNAEFTIASNTVFMTDCVHESDIVISGDDVVVRGCNFSPSSFMLDDTGSNRLIFIGNTIEVGADDDYFISGSNGVFIGNVNKAVGTYDFDFSGAANALVLDHANVPASIKP